VNEPYPKLASALVAGVVARTIKITIPEGYTLAQTAALLHGKIRGFSAARYLDLTRAMVAKALGAGRLSEAELNTVLDRQAERAGVKLRLADLTTEAEAVKDRAGLLRLALTRSWRTIPRCAGALVSAPRKVVPMRRSLLLVALAWLTLAPAGSPARTAMRTSPKPRCGLCRPCVVCCSF